MPGKTDNADADYYIPRRPIHSSTCAFASTLDFQRGMCVSRIRGQTRCLPVVCTDNVRNFSRGYVYTLRTRALSQQLQTGVNILHLASVLISTLAVQLTQVYFVYC